MYYVECSITYYSDVAVVEVFDIDGRGNVELVTNNIFELLRFIEDKEVIWVDNVIGDYHEIVTAN
jgi:hypothetical protein